VAQDSNKPAADLPTRLMERVKAYHAEGDSQQAHQLRVVYFYPSDLSPQADYEGRLGRILADIQDFYLSELKRQGFGEQHLPIEKEEGKLKIHLVKGKEPATAYDYDSGGKVLKELKEALDGVINFDREFVLVMGGMCRKQDDGKYVIHSPYYGWGGSGQRFGLCFAADCELMDTKYFRTTSRKIRYWEHLGDFEKPLASFNHLYIGGLAHELGHGLGLPHNAESPAERKSRGTALMGIGNFTYRQETIGKPGSFLTLASCVRLLSHPLLTQSNHARFAPVRARISELKFAQEDKGLRIQGKVAAQPECYAVIAYTDPAARNDYDARTWVAEVDEDGSFELPITDFKAGTGQLRLAFCHLNGASSTPYHTSYEIPEDLRPDAAEFSGAWVFHQAELAYMSGRKDEAAKWIEAELKANPETSFAPRLAHILQLIYGQGVLKLENIEADAAFLSDVEWESASCWVGSVIPRGSMPLRLLATSSIWLANGMSSRPSWDFKKGCMRLVPPSLSSWGTGRNSIARSC